MLGTHTKQINAYGKRSKRVIEASSTITSGKSAPPSELISIFDDLPPAPAWTGVAAKMKKRENAVLAQPKVLQKLAPKVVGLQKKKRLSPVLSPLKKKQVSRVTQLKEEEKAIKSTPVLSAKSTSNVSRNSVEVMESPPRPLSSAISLHIPASPVVSKPKQRVGSAKATPLRLNKPFTPFVDVDITILDEDGKTISKERRVSKANVKPAPKARKPAEVPVTISISTDGESDAPIPQRTKRPAARKQTIIISDDDSDTEIGEVTPPSPSRRPTKKEAIKAPLRAKPLARSGSSIVEVVIPPAPYKIVQRAPKPIERVEVPPSPPTPGTPPSVQILDNYVPPRQQVDSPILKPRQLTPIRGNRRRLFEPPSPPSPTTPTDFDLSIDFSDLSLGSASSSQRGSYTNDHDSPEYLLPLLKECLQEDCGPHNFSTFIESFAFDPILKQARDHEELQFKKIGEASYSEVFGIGNVVLKVIPLREENKSGVVDDDMVDDGPAPSDAKDVRKEIIVTRAMGEVYGRFVKLLKAYVVKGRYPEVLLNLWDDYSDRKGSENVRPDTFKVSQLYAIIVLPNGGPDLEAYTFQNASKQGWKQACSLFWQVTKALAHAEHLVSFEHRDLHVGQILVRNLPNQVGAHVLKTQSTNQRGRPKAARVFMDDPSHGIEATVIDLGLSRMDAGDGRGGDPVHWTPIDQEVFEGEGDYQFDIYRLMRDMTNGDWEGFHPITNVLWLHYLLQKLITSKGLKPPSVPRKTKGVSSEPPVTSPDAAFTEKDCYDCLINLEDWLGTCIKVVAASMKPKGRSGRKTHATLKPIPSGVAPVRAGEIVAYGVKQGWIKPTPLR